MRTGRPKQSADIECKCRRCGKTWTVPEWQKYGRTYCSQVCYHASHFGKTRRGSSASERTCPTCGKPFLVGGEGNPRRAQTYCSRKCFGRSAAYLGPARTMSLEQAAWLAGLFDGEGSIIFTNPPKLYVRITISNTVRALLDQAQLVAGTGAVIMSTPRKNPKHTQAYWWQSYGENALVLLRQMLPWLIVKREKALKALGEAPE